VGKKHERFDHRRLARLALDPEEIGLHCCGRLIAVEGESVDLIQPNAPVAGKLGFSTFLALQQYDDVAILDAIRVHGSAIENGIHYRRDGSRAENA
jgi:hypothetical protein